MLQVAEAAPGQALLSAYGPGPALQMELKSGTLSLPRTIVNATGGPALQVNSALGELRRGPLPAACLLSLHPPQLLRALPLTACRYHALMCLQPPARWRPLALPNVSKGGWRPPPLPLLLPLLCAHLTPAAAHPLARSRR